MMWNVGCVCGLVWRGDREIACPGCGAIPTPTPSAQRVRAVYLDRDLSRWHNGCPTTTDGPGSS